MLRIFHKKQEGNRGGIKSIHLLLFEDLHPICVLFDFRDEGFFNFVAVTTCYAEDEFVEGGSTEDVNVVAFLIVSWSLQESGMEVCCCVLVACDVGLCSTGWKWRCMYLCLDHRVVRTCLVRGAFRRP